MKLPPALCYYISRPALNTPHTFALAEESSASKSTLAHSKSWNNNYIQQNATQLFIFSLFMNVATLVMGLSERRVRQNPYSVYHNFTDEKTLVAWKWGT